MASVKWHQLALNPQALDTIYVDVPKLENVELFAINLNREGSNIEIRFDLPHFPEHPSKRWNPEFNTVQVKLIFWTVTNFEAKGWQSEMIVQIDMKKKEDLINVVVSASKIDLMFSFSCEMFRIENITAYQNLKQTY